MPKWPDLKKLKQTLDDPAQREQLIGKFQGGLEKGRDEAKQRLSGPAAHLRNVAGQFKTGLTESDATEAPTPTEPSAAAADGGAVASEPPPTAP